jgi:hypothetical protein
MTVLRPLEPFDTSRCYILGRRRRTMTGSKKCRFRRKTHEAACYEHDHLREEIRRKDTREAS